MIDVSAATKTAFLNSIADKQLYVYFPDLDLTLTNDDIAPEGMNLSQMIETESVLTFRGCNASKIELELADLEQDVRGEKIVVTIQAGLTDSIILFKGIVDDQNNINHEDISVKITAYDDLYTKGETDVTDWYANLTFPMTVKAFRDSFFNYLNIAQETATLPCDDLQMTRMVSSDVVLYAKKVMQDICQANARFGQLRSGFFSYIKLKNTPETELTKSDYTDVDYDPYVMQTITKVSVTDDSGVTEESYGSGTNILKIEGNIVAYSIDRAECAERIYNEVSGITMNSARLSLVGLPYLECGDFVSLSTNKNDIEMYILNRSLTGIQALFDSYTSTVDKYMHEVNSVESQLIQRDGRLNHFYRDLDETKLTVANNKTDADGKFTAQRALIDINAGAITSEVSRAEGEESDIRNLITATADAFTVQIQEIYGELDGEISVYYREGEPTKLNYPAWDFTYNIPCNGTVQTTDSLKFIYTDEYYQQNIRDLVYDTNSNLTYRFEKENGVFYWKEIGDTDFSIAMQKISQLEVTTDEISATVSETITELHSDYYTKTQTEGKISTSAGEILLSVSRNYTNTSDLESNYTKQATLDITVDGINASIRDERIAREEGDTNTLTTARSEISASATAIKAQVESNEKVWDTSISGTYINVDYVFYAPNSSTEPSPFNIGKYYLNQQTGTLWWRNANNKYSRQLSVLYNSASSSFTMQSAEIALKVSTDELATEIKAIPGGLTLSTGQLIVNSAYFTLDNQGKGTLGGLTFDQNGFYSEYGGSKILRVYPNAASGFALSVGENNVSRLFYERSGGGFVIRYADDQHPYSIGHDGEVYVTKFEVKDEYTKSGNTYTKTEYGQLHVDNFISCWGNIEIGLESGGGSGIPIDGGSLYVRHHLRDSSGNTGNVIAENYIGCFGRHGGSGDIEAGHDLIYGHACYQSSDERLKKDIEELTDSEDFIYSLKPVKYRYINDDKEEHHGFIAQDIEEIAPADSAIIGENRDGYKMVAYTEIIADLVKTVQMQNERIKALERSA